MAHGHDNLVELLPEFSVGEPCVERAFDAFSREQRSHLLRYFRTHLPSDEDAQDATQESLMRMLRYRDSEPACFSYTPSRAIWTGSCAAAWKRP